MVNLSAVLSCISLLSMGFLLFFLKKIQNHLRHKDQEMQWMIENAKNNQNKAQTEFQQLREQLFQSQLESMKQVSQVIQNGFLQLHQQNALSLNENTERIEKNIQNLNQNIETRLKIISGEVEKRLNEGFEKTTLTFTDVMKRLTIIDEAQKKIGELSTHVVSLQSILSDKKSRGHFGEVQLSALITNFLPSSHTQFQYTLSNGKRADCILLLPKPSGHIVIDSKFPLETYQRLMDNPGENEKKLLSAQFRQDIKKHIQSIAEKYIIANETADGAMMFIPAEAIFAEIHANYPDLVEYAHSMRVWMTSPTTLMAILSTARAVLKDEATRQQVHIIKEHLGYLSKDFERFQKRMELLSKHIQKANEDVHEVHISAKKMTSRFHKIEKVDLSQENQAIHFIEEEEAEEL